MTEENKKPLHCIECGELCDTKEVRRLIMENYPTGIIKTPSECSYEYTCQKCGHKTVFNSSFSFGPTKQERERYSIEASILGCLMLNTDALLGIEALSEEMFQHKKYKKIFNVIVELKKHGFPVDLITVSNFLRENNQLEQIGGTDRIVEILNETVFTKDIASLIELLKSKG